MAGPSPSSGSTSPTRARRSVPARVPRPSAGRSFYSIVRGGRCARGVPEGLPKGKGRRGRRRMDE
eukprot:scaffold64217_cov17-Tisochrysis_lutea.AAC.1